jgi:copper chaperone CopZ
MKFTRRANSFIFRHMKTAIKPALFTALLILTAGCFRNDIRTETFQVQNLKTTADADAIQKSFQRLEGIQEIRPDFEHSTLTVVFNGRTIYIKNIEAAITAAGYGLPNRPVTN